MPLTTNVCVPDVVPAGTMRPVVGGEPSPQGIDAVKLAAEAFGSVVVKVATMPVRSEPSVPVTVAPCAEIDASATVAGAVVVTGGSAAKVLGLVTPPLVVTEVPPVSRMVVVTVNVPSSR